MKNKLNSEYVSIIAFGLIVLLFLIGGYKFQEWKLEYIWNIDNPTFLQVWDSMGHNGKIIYK